MVVGESRHHVCCVGPGKRSRLKVIVASFTFWVYIGSEEH